MPDLAPYLAALPALVTFVQISLSVFGRGQERRLANHLELLAAAPDGSVVKERLLRVVHLESARLSETLVNRARRKVNGLTIVTMVFVVAVVTPLTWWLWTVADGPLPSFVQVLVKIVAAAVALFGILLVTVGGGSQLWVHQDEHAPDPGEEASAQVDGPNESSAAVSTP